MVISMRKRVVWFVCLLAWMISSAAAEAQYGTRRSSGVVGEDYRIEVSFNIWAPQRDIVISSESLGVVGSSINAVEDLGFERESFPEFRAVLRPTQKFKFRIGYTPIKYEAETVLTRRIVFNGQNYNVGVPVNSKFDWKAWRFGLEYDFLYTDRGFLGFIVDAKYQNLRVDLNSPVAAEYASVKVPIPTIGVGGRVYVTDRLAVNGELTGLKLAYQDEEGTYLDWDLGATYNFTRNVGVQAGYRWLSVDYEIDEDFGDLQLNGLYFGGTVRF